MAREAKPHRSGEFDLIAKYFAPLAAAAPGALALTDDAALIQVPTGQELVVSSDALVASVHFRSDDSPDLVARKALRVNLSDLAAMGAAPVGYTLATMLPRDIEESWIAAFAAGLAADQKAFGLSLLGGDTTATPGPLSLTVTIFGLVPAGRALLRRGARPGDLVAVSGTIGDGALGLDAASGALAGLSAEDADFLAGRYRLPQPRLALGQALRGIASAALDISDGLVADLGHIAQGSGVGMRLRVASIPLSPAAARAVARDGTRRGRILAGGDDYELALTISPENSTKLAGIAEATAVPITVIGEVVAGQGVRVADEAGREIGLPAGGYAHF
jgi:thiamine-monophosphate kinase